MNMRIKPNMWVALGIWVAEVIVVFLIQQASGIKYDTWDQSGHNLFFGAGVSLITATILLAITATILGWWKPLIFEKKKSSRRWPIVFPVIMAAFAFINLLVVDWGSYDIAFFGASLVLLLVGFTEEIASRGFLLVGFRTRLSEGWVWFLTSLLFGLMHGVNIFLGADIGPTLGQMAFAFLGGTIFYIARRTTGSLIWAMLLHGLWDFSNFATTHGETSAIAGITNLLYILLGVAAVICVRFVIKDANEKIQVNDAVA